MTQSEEIRCSACNYQTFNVNQLEYPNQPGFFRGKHLASYLEIELGLLYLISDYHSIWNGSIFHVKDKEMVYHQYKIYCDECIERWMEEEKLVPVVVYRHPSPYSLQYTPYIT